VCGVGGKSTTSAMITWIFSQLNIPISFSVGVGNIPGLEKTGQWNKESKFFVAEADEYVIDPNAPHNHETIVPRFSFLQPSIIVCTQLAFDHPDVYRDFEHTQKVFLDFFEQLKPHGHLIIDADQQVLVNLAKQLLQERPDISLHSFGKSTSSTLRLNDISYKDGVLHSSIEVDEKSIPLTLKVPGEHNALNASAACLVVGMNGIPLDKATHALASFQSTQRRFEYKNNVNNTIFYDDYAHHPRELEVVIKTLNDMYPDREIYLAFQPHTFSRTKALFEEFVQALGQAKNVILTEIFASAREQSDPSVSSKLLVESIQQQYPKVNITYVPNLEELTLFCQEKLPSGSVFMTAGAGDIYKIHDKIEH
jgi:UDP-N-acetylmuramate--alanine ligase